jgi:hypothetical protein
MMHGAVTLDEVFAAAAVRAASLVPETSGYLALAVGDATSRLPFAIDDRNVMLTTEGNVGITKRGDVLPPKAAAAGLRDVLARLLAVSTGTAMPALAAAGRAREESDRGVDAVVGEIEAALIPVNRAAARRALARLARETIKAKEAGKVKPRASVRPPAEPPKAAVEAPQAAVEPPKPPPAVAAAPAEAARVEQTAAPHVVVEATTPPPMEAAPVPTPAPRAATPAPVAAATMPVVAAPVPTPSVMLPPPPEATPLPAEAEPTPTELGMAAVEIDGAAADPEAAAHTEIDAVTAPRTPTPAPILRTPTPAALVRRSPTPAPVALKTPAPAPIVRTPTPAPIVVEAQPTVPIFLVTPTPAPAVASKATAPAVATETPAPEPVQAPAPAPVAAPVETVTAAPVETVTAAPVETVTAAPVESVTAAPAEPIAEPIVLAQPSESPTTAFGIASRAVRPVVEPITPPFALEVEPAPRALPTARLVATEPRPTAAEPRITAATVQQAVRGGHTRADDLLARFGASCVDDAGMREAAACLRQIAGIDGTPPPAKVEVRTPEPPRAATYHDAADLTPVEETPIAPRGRARRGRSLPSFAITLAVLVIGVAGGGALVRFRPDLFGAGHPADARPQAAPPAAPRPEPAPAPAAATVEPRGAEAPAWAPSGGARAERGTAERAR